MSIALLHNLRMLLKNTESQECGGCVNWGCSLEKSKFPNATTLLHCEGGRRTGPAERDIGGR
jgi:hypothetical protein